MRKVKKLVAFFVCVLTMTSLLAINTFAVKLPDGGQSANTGVPTAEGRSSGGTDGYANLVCTVSYSNGSLKDSVTSTTKSDVSTGLSVMCKSVIYYTTTSGSENTSKSSSGSTISTNGFKVTVQGPNTHGYKGTAGHTVNYSTRGTWKCGTTVNW